MASIFTRITRGEIPSYKIAEDEDHYAFLDIHPLTKGHTLVIPKKEIPYIFDLSDSKLAALHVFAKSIAIALKNAMSCERVGLTVIGLEVPHAHIHLIPFNQMSEMNFNNKKLKLSEAEFEEISVKIKEMVSLPN